MQSDGFSLTGGKSNEAATESAQLGCRLQVHIFKCTHTHTHAHTNTQKKSIWHIICFDYVSEIYDWLMKLVCVAAKIPAAAYLVYLVLFWETQKCVLVMSRAEDLSVRFKSFQSETSINLSVHKPLLVFWELEPSKELKPYFCYDKNYLCMGVDHTGSYCTCTLFAWLAKTPTPVVNKSTCV